uniref:Heterochromatin protein 1 n=1 Tax=Schizaphis graminum TaxID=13262 RepID=A0A2S2NS21_SCHGA
MKNSLWISSYHGHVIKLLYLLELKPERTCLLRSNKVTKNDPDSNYNKKKRGKKNQEYIVEKILKKRTRYGKVEYFLKWKDYSDSENSWEPIENLNCDDLVASYEAIIKNKPSTSIDFESSDQYDGNNNDEQQKIAQKVVSIKKLHGQIIYYVKFNGIEEPEAITSNKAEQLYSHLIIKYYKNKWYGIK